MLNLELVKEAMTQRGLNQAALAELCQVSREAVSKWFLGEATPRPNKAKLLADVLGQPVKALYKSSTLTPDPVIAYRTQHNVAMSEAASNAALDLGRHLRQLAPLVREPLFAAPVLECPIVDDSYIERVCRVARSELNVGPCDPLTRAQLLQLHRAFGSILVPVLWNGELSGHENALSVWLPESRTSFVVFSLNAKNDDFNYWLSHELGHCYSLHALQGDEGEKFAERFAQELLFPLAAAEEALEKIRASEQPMIQAHLIAEAFGISVVTVIRQADKAAAVRGAAPTGLETEEFWKNWMSNRHLVPTVAYSLFGSPLTDSSQYVERCERYFETPIFKALSKVQQILGGRSPAFISAALNIDLGQAFELSHVLSSRKAD